MEVHNDVVNAGKAVPADGRPRGPDCGDEMTTNERIAEIRALPGAPQEPSEG